MGRLTGEKQLDCTGPIDDPIGEALGVLLAKDQMARHQRDLFSSQPLRRLAALGFLRNHPGVDNVLLLRDYLAWEDKPLLRKRASAVLAGMEQELAAAEGV